MQFWPLKVKWEDFQLFVKVEMQLKMRTLFGLIWASLFYKEVAQKAASS